jgi:hypothetical protein
MILLTPFPLSFAVRLGGGIFHKLHMFPSFISRAAASCRERGEARFLEVFGIRRTGFVRRCKPIFDG